MSRPKPKVIIEKTDRTSYKTTQVLAADGIWAVFFNGQPINLKSLNSLVSYPGPKYRKVSFSNQGHAVNLAKKLNTQFQSDGFSVVLLNKGTTVFSVAKPKN